MEKLIRIGMDTSKQFFQVHGVNALEQPVLRKRLRRKEVLRFFAALEPTVIGIEACGGSHYWGRELQRLGHEPKLVPTQYVKPYVKRGKNDGADADGLCEATGRPSMRFVPVKSAENQAALMLAGMRDRLVRNRTQLCNAIRGYAGEFGITAPKGICKIELLLAHIREDEALPALAKDLFELHAEEYAQLSARVEEIERRLMAWHRNDPASRRLATIPGIGPIGASLLVMKAPDPQLFRSGRQFAAWLGLTPKDHSTAGKQKLGGITRAGDEMLRSVLVAGAMAVLQHQKRRRGQPAPDLTRLLQRKPLKLAAIALANRNARVAWRLMTNREVYDPLRRRPAEDRAVLGAVKDLRPRAAVASQSLTAPARGAAV